MSEKLKKAAQEFQSTKTRDGWSSLTQKDFFGREKVIEMLIDFATSDEVKKYHLKKKKLNKTKLKYAEFISKQPSKLHEIITLSKSYPVYEEKGEEIKLCLDNDFSHWINKRYLKNFIYE